METGLCWAGGRAVVGGGADEDGARVAVTNMEWAAQSEVENRRGDGSKSASQGASFILGGRAR